MYILRALTKNSEERFYTGRAGQSNWVSADRGEAFTYSSQNVARTKAKNFNRMVAIHGIWFIAIPAAEVTA